MKNMLTLRIEDVPADIDFASLRRNGSPFRSAGNVIKVRGEDCFDVWLCGADTAEELARCARIAIDEVIALAGSRKLSGYFYIGLFPDVAERVNMIDLASDILLSIAMIGLGLSICYYPED